MADIPIWNGSSTFAVGQTPFGFYDTDAEFTADIDKVAKWCANRLGWPIVAVELQSGSFYAAFEEAITAYGNEVYQYKVRENYLSLEGNSTGSVLNNELLTPSLGTSIRMAKNYGTEAGSGGNVTYHTGSITLVAGQQDYDLNQWTLDMGFTSSIEVRRVVHDAYPAAVRFFDPWAGSGMGMQNLYETFGWGQMSPGVNFMLMPIYFDVQKIQAIEFNDTIRRSAYSFDLVNNKLRLFPIPTAELNLFFHYIFINERDSAIVPALVPGGNSGLVNNISNVPYNNPVYGQINSIGKQWIYQYTLATAKEMLGLIRDKYKSVPIPGAEVTLNGADLVSSAKDEKAALLEQLRLTLEETSRKAQLERQKQEAENLRDQLTQVPLLIYMF